MKRKRFEEEQRKRKIRIKSEITIVYKKRNDFRNPDPFQLELDGNISDESEEMPEQLSVSVVSSDSDSKEKLENISSSQMKTLRPNCRKRKQIANCLNKSFSLPPYCVGSTGTCKIDISEIMHNRKMRRKGKDVFFVNGIKLNEEPSTANSDQYSCLRLSEDKNEVSKEAAPSVSQNCKALSNPAPKTEKIRPILEVPPIIKPRTVFYPKTQPRLTRGKPLSKSASMENVSYSNDENSLTISGEVLKDANVNIPSRFNQRSPARKRKSFSPKSIVKIPKLKPIEEEDELRENGKGLYPKTWLMNLSNKFASNFDLTTLSLSKISGLGNDSKDEQNRMLIGCSGEKPGEAPIRASFVSKGDTKTKVEEPEGAGNPVPNLFSKVCMKRYKAFHRWGELKTKKVKFMMGHGTFEIDKSNGSKYLVVDKIPGKDESKKVIILQNNSSFPSPENYMDKFNKIGSECIPGVRNFISTVESSANKISLDDLKSPLRSKNSFRKSPYPSRKSNFDHIKNNKQKMNFFHNLTIDELLNQSERDKLSSIPSPPNKSKAVKDLANKIDCTSKTLPNKTYWITRNGRPFYTEKERDLDSAPSPSVKTSIAKFESTHIQKKPVTSDNRLRSGDIFRNGPITRGGHICCQKKNVGKEPRNVADLSHLKKPTGKPVSSKSNHTDNPKISSQSSHKLEMTGKFPCSSARRVGFQANSAKSKLNSTHLKSHKVDCDAETRFSRKFPSRSGSAVKVTGR